VYHQRFAVEYDYPVHFTENLFGTDNPIFAQVLSRKEVAKRHRFVVFIDASVAAAWPTLVHEVASYAKAHAESMELVGLPELVAAGEQIKNDMAVITRLQQRLVELAVDRHTYVVGIGGGAFLDAIG